MLVAFSVFSAQSQKYLPPTSLLIGLHSNSIAKYSVKLKPRDEPRITSQNTRSN